MKRLVGGEYLLDLSPIELEQSVDGETYTNITNAEILEQLTNLKKFVPNPKMIKPAWVKLYNGETDELVVVHGQVSNVDDGEFDIDVAISGYKLKIHVEFTQAVNSDSVPIDDWYIDTNDAKYLFTSDAQSIGAISSLPVFENIVDKDGHKRFIEGGIDLTGYVPEGITKTYGKWSLSGSHLMIVLGGNIPNETVIPSATLWAIIGLPQWIKDKIFPLVLDDIYSTTGLLYGQDGTNQTLTLLLRKTGNEIRIVTSSVTATKDRLFRFAFDLLIDNE